MTDDGSPKTQAVVVPTRKRTPRVPKLTPEPPAPIVEVVPSTPMTAARRLRSLEDELLTEATRIVAGVMSFDAIDPESETPPQEWRQLHGEEEALRRYRLAKYGLMSRKDAPIAITVAQQTHQAITRPGRSRSPAPGCST